MLWVESCPRSKKRDILESDPAPTPQDTTLCGNGVVSTVGSLGESEPLTQYDWCAAGREDSGTHTEKAGDPCVQMAVGVMHPHAEARRRQGGSCRFWGAGGGLPDILFQTPGLQGVR